MTSSELNFMHKLKSGEARFRIGETMIEEGSQSPFLFTMLSGWAMRTCTLESGGRQVLNFLLPGDLVGLQSAMVGRMYHSVEALTPVLACALPMQGFLQLFRSHNSLARDVGIISELEKATLDELLISSGKRSVSERICFLLLHLFDRACTVGLVENDSLHVPFGQEVLADAIGMSLVHTNKSLTKLRQLGLFSWVGRELRIIDRAAMGQFIGGKAVARVPKPFL